MGFKDPGLLAHSAPYIYLIWMHPDYSQGLYLDPFQCRTFTQNMHCIFCIRKPLLFSTHAALAADGCIQLEAPSITLSVSYLTYLHARHTCRLIRSTHGWLVPYPILFLIQSNSLSS